MLQKAMIVGIGSALGAVLRYEIYMWLPDKGIGLETMIVNTIGSFFLGLLTAVFSDRKRKTVSLLWGTGACGGFTTMSTFAADVFHLMENEILLGIVYIALTLFFGIGAGLSGILVGRRMK
ncbi:fluoride efflux transporter FluC [Peribacillus tepidiphilus]|uniref:fluoride efflux transporter FluC n=1 Tax=Peribacillus tepidiphilus TaxID=2652445 RepID=UPI0035B50D2D